MPLPANQDELNRAALIKERAYTRGWRSARDKSFGLTQSLAAFAAGRKDAEAAVAIGRDIAWSQGGGAPARIPEPITIVAEESERPRRRVPVVGVVA